LQNRDVPNKTRYYTQRALLLSGIFAQSSEDAGKLRVGVEQHFRDVGDIMIGPPGLPKYGRRVFAFAARKRSRSRQQQNAWKWVTGLYLAGVLAHFSHHMVGLPDGSDPSSEALSSAPISLVWPADLMKTLITLG
jgi:hypothetical protein